MIQAGLTRRKAKAKVGVRKDPPVKEVDLTQLPGALTGADPARYYKLVPLTGMFGVQYHEALGYEVEKKRPGGVRFTRGGTRTEDGESLMYMDLVLMSMPLERRQEIYDRGVTGTGGQLAADRYDRRMVAGRGRVSRSLPGHDVTVDETMGLVNETDDIKEELYR